MQEGVISFETAKLAKDKGFNEISDEHFLLIPALDKDVEIKRCEFKTNEGLNLYYNNIKIWTFCSRPTQTLLQKWLRELRTPIVVTPVTDFVAWEVEIDHPDKGTIIVAKNHEDKWFNSYEEALEIGLQEGLKLI